MGLAFNLDDDEQARGRIVLRGDASISETETTHLVIVYPDSYPHTRFAIYAPDLALDRHQNPFERNLCILPRASDYWQPQFLAADFVASDVPSLSSLVRQGGDVLRDQEDPQGEPFSTYLDYFPLGGVIVPEAALHIPNSVDSGVLELKFQGTHWIEQMVRGATEPAPEIGQALLSSVSDRSSTTVANADPELIDAFPGPRWRGRWVRLNRPPLASDANSLARQIAGVDPKLLKWQRLNRSDSLRFDVLGVVFSEEVRQGEYEDIWVFLFVGGKANGKGYPGNANLFRGLRVSREHLYERIPELTQLSEKAVSVLGLGSLGSRFVHDLARAQIGVAHLGDFDFVEAGSIVRWNWGLEAAGANKTDFIRGELRRNYPFTRTRTYYLPVGAATLDRGAVGEFQALEEWAERSNLLVDATAESNVSRLISEIGWALHIPQIYLWSVDGHGGVIARLARSRTGCFHCLELALADGGGITPPRPSARPVKIQPRGCADQTFSAPGVDLNPIADQAARVATSTLLEDSAGYPEIAGDVWVLQLRNPDGSLLSAPDWNVYSLPPDRRCPLCFSADQTL